MQTRVDRATLREPVRMDDGSLRVEAVTSRVDVPLQYPWGVEVATEAALSDDEYLDALRGLPIMVHHPDGGKARLGMVRAGTITGARYDPDERALIQEWTLHDEQTISDVLAKRYTGASEGYDVDLDPEDSTRQIKRRPNHVAITDTPRAGGTTIRTDEEQTMTEEEVKALIEPLLKRIAALEADEAEEVEVIEVIESREDAHDIAVRLVALHRRADALGIKVPDEAQTEAEIAKAIAVELGADAARCDSIDYCMGIVDTAKVPEKARVWGERSDSTTTSDYAI